MKANIMSKEVLVVSLLCRLAIVQCGAPFVRNEGRSGVVGLLNSSIWKVASVDCKFLLLKDYVEREYGLAEGHQKNLLAKAREVYQGQNF